MGIVRKHFIIVSSMIITTFTVLLLLIYFSVPVYYNQAKQQNLKETFNNVVSKLDGKSKDEILFVIRNEDKIHPNLYLNLLDTAGNSLYPTLVELEQEKNSTYVKEHGFTNFGAFTANIKTEDGELLGVQGEYGFHSLSDTSQILVTFYPFVLGVIFLVISSATVVSYIYSRLSNKRITDLSEKVKQMRSLEKGLECSAYGQDEISNLGKNINTLYSKLLLSIDELKVENEKAILREKQKVVFLQMASHELKTPIASMMGIVEGMLYNVGKFKDHDKYLKKCHNILNEQSELVQSILESTQEKDSIASEFSEIRIDEMLLENMERYNVLSEVNNYNFDVTLEEVRVIANKVYLLKAINNILDNAFRYTKKNGTIKLILTKERLVIENEAEYLLSNEELEQIFQPFYRPDFSRNRKDGGTGIGLYLVKQILDKHNYNYSMDVKKDKYVNFTINFR